MKRLALAVLLGCLLGAQAQRVAVLGAGVGGAVAADQLRALLGPAAELTV